MDHFEMIEKLREKANVSYEQAANALEKCNWDLLDALLMLERSGKLSQKNQAPANSKSGTDTWRTLARSLFQAVRTLNTAELLIKKNNTVHLEFSLFSVLILFIFSFWGVVIVLLVALLCGCRFAVCGLRFDTSINAGIDKATNFVHNTAKSILASGKKSTDNTPE